MSITPSKTGIDYSNGILLKNLKSMEPSIRYDSYLKKKETKRRETLLEGLKLLKLAGQNYMCAKHIPPIP